MRIGSQTFSGVQRTKHEPFPVADFVEGMSLSKEPWLSPRNAFRTMNEARVFRGRLEKRKGFSRFAEVTTDLADDTANDWLEVSGLYYYHTAVDTDKPIPESILFTWDNNGGTDIYAELQLSSETWVDDTISYPVWQWNIVEQGTSTVLGTSGWRPGDPAADRFLATVRWTLHSGYTDVDPAGGTLSYRKNPGDAIVGLARLQTSLGDYALAVDTKNVYLYDASDGYYTVQGKASAYDYFTGSATEFFWIWPLDDYIVMTNNKDAVHRWTPTTAATSVEEMPTDWDGGGNELTRCKIVLRFRGRLLYMNTTEDGAGTFPTRVRFTASGSFTAWDSALDYADAPSELGEINTAQFIGERLFVGFDRGWMELVATGDSTQPFDWRPFISRFGAVSPLSTIRDNERLLSRSETTMQAVDPNGQYYIDTEIPDLAQSFNAEYVSLCASIRNEVDRAFWWTYVRGSATSPNRILSATYDDKNELSWSQYSMRFNVFSEFDSTQTPSWNDLGPNSMNSYVGVTFNNAHLSSAGFTNIIGGGVNGTVYVFDNSNADRYLSGEEAIEFSVESQLWAPFPGEAAHLGWLDVYASASSGGSFTVFFYSDLENAAYLSSTIELTASGNASKVYRRIPVDRVSSFHRLRIESSDGKALKIDAIIPWFRPAGRIRTFN